MIHAVSFALADSINLLLIGILVALGVMLRRQARYGGIAALVLVGDWLGVLVCALVTTLAFDQIRDQVATALDSPIFGVFLIVVGLVSAGVSTRGGGNNDLVTRLMGPLRTPSARTLGMGFVLGVVQSATSLPFYTGLGYLVISDLPVVARYGGLVGYATLALSLPILCALLIGWVRRFPDSPAGRAFDRARAHPGPLSRAAGYLVAIFLIVMGMMTL